MKLSRTEKVIMDLCDPSRLEAVQIEFTSSCNLKCSYCAVSQPAYVANTLEEQTIERIITDIVSLGVVNAVVNGHGETTILPGWHRHIRKLAEAGIAVSAISNLSKHYSAEELDTLAKFAVLVISIDTIDIELFKQLRRGGDLRRIIYNISAVRSHALSLGLNPPVFRWASVVCDRTVFDLPSVVSYGLALGIKDFAFQNLVKMASVKNAIELMPIASMPPEELARIPAIFEQIEQTIAAHGGTCEIQPGIREAITAAANDEQIAGTMVRGGLVYRADKSQQGMTRDCIDPWNNLHVTAQGMVKPCCVMKESVGQIDADHGIQDIVDGPLMREYRESILTGTLKGSCRACHSRGWITPQAMADKVRAYIARITPGIEPEVVDTPEPAIIPEPPEPSFEPEPALGIEFDTLRQRLTAIEQSTSWRITAPLRAVKQAADRVISLR